MDQSDALMGAILPTTYVIVDLIKPIPFIPEWALPILAAITGTILGVGWAATQGYTTSAELMTYGALGFSFGSGATGVNQIRRQSEKRRYLGSRPRVKLSTEPSSETGTS